MAIEPEDNDASGNAGNPDTNVLTDATNKLSEITQQGTTPLASLYDNKYKNVFLQFPKRIESAEENTWIRFNIKEMKGVAIKKYPSRDLFAEQSNGGIINKLVSAGVDKASALTKTAIQAPVAIAKGVTNQFLSELPPGLSDIARGLFESKDASRMKKDSLAAIVLYAPVNQQVSSAFTWEQMDTKAGGGAIKDALGGGGLKDNAVIKGLINNFGRVGAGKVGAVVGGLTGTSSEAGEQLVLRNVNAAYNNQLTAFFKGVAFRTIRFSFVLAPRNSADAREIQKIIQMFKYAAAPGLEDGEAGLFFSYPQVFDIEFHNQKETQKYMESALTNVDVNYSGAGTGNATFYDKYPVVVELTLDFLELSILDKNKVDAGY